MKCFPKLSHLTGTKHWEKKKDCLNLESYSLQTYSNNRLKGPQYTPCPLSLTYRCAPICIYSVIFSSPSEKPDTRKEARFGYRSSLSHSTTENTWETRKSRSFRRITTLNPITNIHQNILRNTPFNKVIVVAYKIINTNCSSASGR